jgi:hypothetical protein
MCQHTSSIPLGVRFEHLFLAFSVQERSCSFSKLRVWYDECKPHVQTYRVNSASISVVLVTITFEEIEEVKNIE